MTLLAAVPEYDVERLVSQATVDELEAAVRRVAVDEAAWLQAHLNQLEHALDLLRLASACAVDARRGPSVAERTLGAALASCRARLGAVSQAGAALRAD